MGPLDGLHVVELAGIGPVPYAGMVLADFGADVVRVDRQPTDRPWVPHRILDRGRRSVALDLKRPEAVDAVLRLVERSDVLIEGYRPGVAERLGLGPDECRGRNPGLVYARMTGWGQDGPLAGTAGQWRPERGTNLLDGGAPFYAVYPCADGRYVAVGAIEEPFWRALLAGLGLDPAQLPDRADPLSWPALRDTIAGRFATREQAEWVAAFDGTDACVTPVLTLVQAQSHPQAGRAFTGGEPAPAPRFSRTPGAVRRPAPAPGGHPGRLLAGAGALLLVGAGTLRAAGWLFVLCLAAAVPLGSLAVAGTGRTWRRAARGAVAVLFAVPGAGELVRAVRLPRILPG